MDTLTSITHAEKKKKKNMSRNKAGILLHKTYKFLMALFSIYPATL